MKKLMSVAVLACMILGCVCAFAENTDFLSGISGEYVELFPVFRANSEYWNETYSRVTGCDPGTAAEGVDMLLSMYEADIYGEEAAEAYGDMSEGFAFNCNFIGGVKRFVIDGNRITGIDADGNEVFSHTYTYSGDVEYAEYPGMGFYFHTYKSDDPDSGIFSQFAFADDTPAETYHLEFRYGEQEDGLTNCYSGPYAFYMASALPADANEEMIHACIDLFAEENLNAD